MKHDEQREDTGADPSEQYRVYIEQRKIYLDAEQTQAASYDKWILTLSGGAIAVSLTFVKDIIGPKPPDCSWLLWVGWSALTAALGMGLISIYGSQRAHEQYKDLLDDAYNEHGGDFLEPLRRKQGEKVWPKAIVLLNLGSVFSFVIGLLMLCFFTGINVSNREVKNDSVNPSVGNVQEDPRGTRGKPSQGSSQDPGPKGDFRPQDGITATAKEKGESKVNQSDPKPASSQPITQPTTAPITIRTDLKTIDIGAGSVPPKAPAPMPKPPIGKDK